jgi:TRAP-type C4-dicarboxylate transport system permease small subunit
MNQAANTLIRVINKLEDALLVLILSSMILLSIYQVLARNFFSEGAVWIDPMLRMLVLWVGLAGAVVATRTDNHIRIDILTKYLPAGLRGHVQRLVYLFTISICLLITWHATRFVISEYEYASMAFASIPTWLTASIIPVGFFLIAMRYLLLFIKPSLSTSVKGDMPHPIDDPTHQAVHIPERSSVLPNGDPSSKEGKS